MTAVRVDSAMVAASIVAIQTALRTIHATRSRVAGSGIASSETEIAIATGIATLT